VDINFGILGYFGGKIQEFEALDTRSRLAVFGVMEICSKEMGSMVVWSTGTCYFLQFLLYTMD